LRDDKETVEGRAPRKREARTGGPREETSRGVALETTGGRAVPVKSGTRAKGSGTEEKGADGTRGRYGSVEMCEG
jgi:hypothetical protein